MEELGHRARSPALSGHALAIARWDRNSPAWLDGKYFGLASNRRDLQDLIGDGGTLWIVLSRRVPTGGRNYSLSFRLDGCRKHTFRHPTEFGQFAVVADRSKATLFAANDARLLLLALRFEPPKPIDHPVDRLRVIGQSIQTPRALSTVDAKLLSEFSAESDRWSVFISYQGTDRDRTLAARLSAALHARGVAVFRDKESLRGGEKWWPVLQRAIERSRFFVLIVGDTTLHSPWVKKELQLALEQGISVIPILAGGTLGAWAGFGLAERHALDISLCQWGALVDQLCSAVAK
ncbi:toll/interleukin-1 receptor domain-containing protein [Roseateles sp.]|uniref:toll/interleukin-1 receptor domain-containing protein n=1 Tax=Roseateles sp. TaxID=1971397 RepID=UPI003BA7B6AE